MDVEEIVQFIKRTTLELGKCYPTVFVKGSQGKVAIGLEEFGETSDVREMHMLNAGTFTAHKHSVGELELLVFAGEAWMSMVKGKENFIQPSLDPNHIEALLINSLDMATQDETLIAFEVVKDRKGKITDLKQMSLPDGGSVKGRLLPAFQKGYQIIRPITN